MRVLEIVPGTTVDGPGLRTSIYFAGCHHHCPSCHNPESWDMAGGKEMAVEEILSYAIEEDFDVTFTGGDPLAQVEELIELAQKIKAHGKNIWCYTGYLYEDVVVDSALSPILRYIDVLVDGRFHIDERDVKLVFKGSRNQRIIDVKKSTLASPVIWESPE
ncbi:MAG: anaerobic ribonucleoside-triphosphate reductase activating protein [Duncaniella sp.]|nr:anaerobic ribonucleoside-triphosphate reductase activating protein [Duncaniella sp.]